MAPSRRVVPYQFAFVGFLFADTQIYEVSSIGPLVRQSVGPWWSSWKVFVSV